MEVLPPPFHTYPSERRVVSNRTPARPEFATIEAQYTSFKFRDGQRRFADRRSPGIGPGRNLAVGDGAALPAAGWIFAGGFFALCDCRPVGLQLWNSLEKSYCCFACVDLALVGGDTDFPADSPTDQP